MSQSHRSGKRSESLGSSGNLQVSESLEQYLSPLMRREQKQETPTSVLTSDPCRMSQNTASNQYRIHPTHPTAKVEPKEGSRRTSLEYEAEGSVSGNARRAGIQRNHLEYRDEHEDGAHRSRIPLLLQFLAMEAQLA